MTILDAAREALRMLNHIEVRGEQNIAAMSTALSLIKGIKEGLEQLERVKEGQGDDGDDQQG